MKQGSAYLSPDRSMKASSKVLTTLDNICAVLLASCPILQHYVGPLYNAALTVLVILVPYLILRILPRLFPFSLDRISLGAVTILYFIYRVVDHGTSLTELGQSGVFVIYMVAMALGCINVRLMVKTAACISLTASACLLLQYICFYIFGFHVQMVPTSLFLPMADQWKLGAQTGLAGITGRQSDFYRPSAFFLEPSHVFQYMFPYLVLALFSVKMTRKSLTVAVILTLGLVLSTSGMAIAASAGIWGLFLILKGKDGTFSIKNVIRPRNLMLEALLLTLLCLMFVFIPTVQRTVMRIFSTGTGVTAITGRVSKAFSLLFTLSPRQWILGVSDTTHSISFNMPGFVSTIYRHGLIGLVLGYEFYVKALFKLKLPYVIISGLIIGISFFSAHTHSTIGMLYFFLILMSGYPVKRNNPLRTR